MFRARARRGAQLRSYSGDESATCREHRPGLGCCGVAPSLACSFCDVGVSLRRFRSNSRMTTTLSLGRISFPHWFQGHSGGFGLCGEGPLSCLLFLRCRGGPSKFYGKSKDEHNSLFGWNRFSTFFPRAQERLGFLWWGCSIWLALSVMSV